MTSDPIRKTVRSVGFAAAVLLVAAGSALAAGYELRDGLIVDPLGKMAYVMNPAGGIDGLRLGDGNLQWHSDAAAKPLAVSGGALVAQVEAKEAGRLELKTIDRANGRLLAAAASELPEDVMAGVVGTLDGVFETWAESDRGALRVGWKYARRPGRFEPPGAAKETRGAVVVEAAEGALRATASEAGEPPVRRRRSDVEGRHLRGVEGRQFLSEDGRHVLVSRPRADERAWDRYDWTIYDRRGRRLGGLSSHLSYSPFLVADGTVLFPAPPHARRTAGDEVEALGVRLMAVDLVSGAEQWRAEVRDTDYRGPFPP